MHEDRRLKVGLSDEQQPTLLADLDDFVSLHRLYGELHADAGEPAPNGYRLTVACPCGVTFEIP
jgi:hypothetical protein